MKRKFLIIIAGLLICMQTISISAVSESSDVKKKATDNSSQIAEKENENADLNEKIEELNKEIEETKFEIADLKQRISDANSTLKGLNGSIKYNKEKLKERLRVIYMTGGASRIEVILGAKSFDDLINNMEYASIVAEHDNRIINNLSQDVNVNKKTQKVLNSAKLKLEEKNSELVKKREEFLKTLNENKEILNYLYNENATITEHSINNEELENKISGYYNKQKSTELSTESSTNKKNNSSSSSSTKATSPTLPNVITSNGSKTNNSNSSKISSSTTDIYKDNSKDNNSSDERISIISTDVDVSSSGYIWPVTGFYNLTSLWNENRGEYNHGAIDIASSGIDGQNVLSAHSGTVMYAENNCIHNWGKSESCGCGGGYGNYVMLDHGDGYMTVYAHMSSVLVSTGDTIEAGQILGFVGSTGDSTGAHLHFETRYEGVKYNPMTEYPDISITY